MVEIPPWDASYEKTSCALATNRRMRKHELKNFVIEQSPVCHHKFMKYHVQLLFDIQTFDSKVSLLGASSTLYWPGKTGLMPINAT